MAHRGVTRSPRRHPSAQSVALIGASEHAADKKDEDEVSSVADFTHLAATILDEAIQRISARKLYDARLMSLDRHLKRDVIDATHIPLTRDDLARRCAKGPAKKPPSQAKKGGLWPTTMESISRSVAAYHHFAIAADHDTCDQTIDTIGAYAHTLRLRTHRPQDFIKMLHQWIENRSINVALKNTRKRASEPPGGIFTEQTVWRLCNAEEQFRAIEILTRALDIVRANGDVIRSAIRTQHEYN